MTTSSRSSARPTRLSSKLSPATDATTVQTLLQTALDCHRQGDLDAAVQGYDAILQLHPQHAEALHLKGVAQLARGHAKSATTLIRQAITHAPNVAGYHLNLGTAERTLENAQAAMLAYEQALRIDPGLVDAWAALGDLLVSVRHFEVALDCLRQATRLDPTHLTATLNLATASMETGQVEAAREAFLRVLALQPKHLVARVNLAVLERQQGRPEQAIELLTPIAEKASEQPTIAYNLGNALADCGRFEEARRHYEAALQSHSSPAKVLFNLSQVTRFREEDEPQIAQWKTQITSRPLSAEETTSLEFALGKIHDDFGKYAEAWQHYRTANESVQVEFSSAALEDYVAKCRETFEHDLFAERVEGGSSAEEIVFVVGVPRSGTTLVEQVLAAHPQVHARGEQDDLGTLITQFVAGQGRHPDDCRVARDASESDIAQLASAYHQQVQPTAGEFLRITDKLPQNFLFLGWVGLCFPKARILYCVRDPRDTCLSCYFQHFTHRLAFSYDLGHTIEYWRAAQQLMEHWMQALPNPILPVSYEALVEDPATMRRQIVSFAGLDWDDACEQQERAHRPVTTASQWQVRQPVYRSSRGRWRNYAPFASELIEAFGDADEPRLEAL